jgi:hypothetical protein
MTTRKEKVGEDYERGWNDAFLDMLEGRVRTPSKIVGRSEEYVDGYQEGQDHVLHLRSLQRQWS